jgi:hypothetical protein
MGRKNKSRRVTKARYKRMGKVKGKFREAKGAPKRVKTPKVNPKRQPKKIKIKRPKVDRSKKIGFLKKMRKKIKAMVDEK